MTAPRVSWILWWGALGAFAAAVVLRGVHGWDIPDSGDLPLSAELLFLLLPLVTATVGRLIATRRPENALGWLLGAFGLVLAVGFAAANYSLYGSANRTGSLPLVDGAAWLGSLLLDSGGAFAPFVFLFLFYPTGHLPSPRWRPFTWAAVIMLTTGLLGVAVTPGPLPGSPDIENPIGVAAIANVTAIGDIAYLASMLTTSLAAAASLLHRFRRAREIERLQVKWLTFTAAIFAIVVLTSPFAFVSAGLGQQVWQISLPLALLMVPGAIGVAILRYRLYDIDRLISRTVSYGLVTAVAVGLFALVVLAPITLLDLGDAPPALIAVATLVAAGVFNPLRRRIQALVDRRFNRARYDAQVVADGFGSRLREPRDLDRVTADLAGTVAATMRPDRLGIWVRA